MSFVNVYILSNIMSTIYPNFVNVFCKLLDQLTPRVLVLIHSTGTVL